MTKDTSREAAVSKQVMIEVEYLARLRRIEAAARDAVAMWEDPNVTWPDDRLGALRAALATDGAETSDRRCPDCGHAENRHTGGGMCDGNGTTCHCVRMNPIEDALATNGAET